MTPQVFTQAMLPDFKSIHPQQIVPELTQRLENNRIKIKELLSQPQPFTWENLMLPMENMSDELSKFWSPISHLHSVLETEELRKAYHAALPLLTQYETELNQNEDLFNAIYSIANGVEFDQLNPAQRKIIENDIRDFKLSGIHLPTHKKARLAELQDKLSKLMTQFSENLLDATSDWYLHVTDKEQVAGLPAQALQLAIENAKQRDLDGYVFTLDFPSYSTAIKYLNNRLLREKLHEAHATRASDIGPQGGKWDNTKNIDHILALRHEKAQLVELNNFAEFSLATKMAKKPEMVLQFLQDLLTKSKPIAEKEFAEVAALANKLDGIKKIEPWDVAYYSEKLAESKFHFTPEDFRPYFPIKKVLAGMFQLINKLYGITISEDSNANVWHPDVTFFNIHDNDGSLRGGFYTDLYARPHKREGAWMDECRSRRSINGHIQLPVAYLTCNFMPPVNGNPGLLSHDEVVTLFHEFGHCLHHMLTKVDYPSVGGINGVAWDAVEFPSQFMENYCWEKETLAMISGHYQTGEALPDELYNKLHASRHFQTGMMMVRQLEFALFDFHLHLDFDPHKGARVQQILNEVRKQTSVIPVASYNRFQHSFGHIFGGGYAAGYYSYKWAEVLSSDAYSAFEEKGLYDQEVGLNFLHNILEVGGVRDPMESFVAFRGRTPKIDALLRHSGIA